MKGKRLMLLLLIMALVCAAAFAEERITKIKDVPVREVPQVTAKRANGVITAEEWTEYYPEIVESLSMNRDNTERVKYTETNPDIQILYDGMGFASTVTGYFDCYINFTHD